MYVSLIFQEEVVACRLLLLVFHRVHLVDPGAEVAGITTEGDAECLQKLVHSAQQRLRPGCDNSGEFDGSCLFDRDDWILRVGDGVDRGNSVKDNDTVSHVSGHDEVMLDDEGGLFRVEDEPLNG